MRVFIILLVVSLFLYACDRPNTPPPKYTTNIAMIKHHPKSSGYIIMLDGYTTKWWYYSDIKIRIDETVIKGKPQATFYLDSWNNPHSLQTIVLTFNSVDEVKKAMGTIDTNVEVEAGRDVHIAIAKRQSKSGCFIGAIYKW